MSQEEVLELDGAIQISNSADPTPDAGTIRWTGTDFEGWNGQMWYSLTMPTITCDVDGNDYKIVTIGNQVWFAENLKTSRYKDGTPIPLEMDSLSWTGLTSGAYTHQANQNTNDEKYGKLYNFYAVIDSNGLCPEGWKVPSMSDYQVLINSIGTSLTAGGKLKEVGTINWSSPNTDATNEYRFRDVPGGQRDEGSNFFDFSFNSYLWTNTPANIDDGEFYISYHNNGNLTNLSADKRSGFSVRCIKE